MNDAIAAFCVMGFVYCMGGIHGLMLAWSQPARIHRWSGAAEQAFNRLYAVEDVPPHFGPGAPPDADRSAA